MRWIRRLLQNNRGQAMVEFALVLPVLLLILGAIIEYGRVFNETLTVTAAAREGARAAAVGDDGPATALGFAAAIDRGKLTATVVPAAPVRGQPVTVTVKNPVPITFPVITAILGDSVTVSGTATMRTE